MYSVLRLRRVTPLDEKLPNSKVHFDCSVFCNDGSIFMDCSCFASFLKKFFDIDVNVNELFCFIDIESKRCLFAYRFQDNFIFDDLNYSDSSIKPHYLKVIDLRSPISKVLLPAVYTKSCRFDSIDSAISRIQDYFQKVLFHPIQLKLDLETPF